MHAIIDKEKQEERELEEVHCTEQQKKVVGGGKRCSRANVDLQHCNNWAELSAMQRDCSHPSQHRTTVRVSTTTKNLILF